MKNWILALTLGIIVAGCSSGGTETAGSTGTSGSGGSALTLTGAGSSFVNPAMSKWAYAYHEANSGINVDYQPKGSGAGISQFQAGTVDFAASDVAMTDEEIAKSPNGAVQIPVIAGCTVLSYNLPGIQNGLKLSGEVVADIFLGKITKWNDPRIVADNAGMTLPDLTIQVAHRSDGSGTTYIFTDYLAAVSPAWKAGPGKGKTVDWPVGVGGKGNDGVAGLVKQTPGGIGYVELAYAIQAKLTYGPVKNKSGNFVEPSLESTTAAVDAAVDSLKADIRSSIVNTSAPQGYPIAGVTYAIVAKTPKDSAKTKAAVDFLKWVLASGQDMAKELQYAPLAKPIIDLDGTILGEVQAK